MRRRRCLLRMVRVLLLGTVCFLLSTGLVSCCKRVCSGSIKDSATPAVPAKTEEETAAREGRFPAVLLEDERQPDSFLGVAVTNLTMGEPYAPGKNVLLAFEMRNAGEEPAELQFPTGRRFDFAVFDSKKEVWRFSRHRTVSGEGHTQVVNAGEGEVFRVTWDQKDNYGRQVPEGYYIVRGYLMSEPQLQTGEADIVISE